MTKDWFYPNTKDVWAFNQSRSKYANGYYWLRHIKHNSPPEIGHIIYGDVYNTFAHIGNGTKVEEYEILEGPLVYQPKQDMGQQPLV